VVSSVEMVNALVGDRLAAAWGRVLAANSAITALNLESNSISSAGIEALAEGVRSNSALRQLKLANQHVSFSQPSEEALAEALEANHTLTNVTIDLRSTLAREVVQKSLQRNSFRPIFLAFILI